MSARTLIADPYVLLVTAAALVAAGERSVARRNEVRLLREGAAEVAPWVYRVMLPVYALVFPAALAERWLLARRAPPALVYVSLAVFLAAKGLKLWVIRSLGDRWTMRVILPRVFRVVTGGPYRLVRHPNYVAVLLEVVALPLAGGAWITAALAALLFLALLRARVLTEERALFERPEYAAAMGRKGRFVPGERR